MTLDYIECAGVKVPEDWSIEQLRSALGKRKIRFQSEGEILRVFGEAVMLKRQLEQETQSLKEEIQSSKKEIAGLRLRITKQLKLQLTCPLCHRGFFMDRDKIKEVNK